VRDPRYSNVRALVETDAARILWPDELVDADRGALFRPRDAATPASAAVPRRAMGN